MARMLPPEVWSGTKSAAERRIFNSIRKGLPDGEWCALHSLGLADHESKPWAEVDFVLVGPSGVFCLEVKGGRIQHRDGVWHYVDRFGDSNASPHGPFEQVGSARGALRGYLVSHAKRLSDVVVGYGVVTPDIEWTIQAPDCEPSLVYDSRDACKPFKAYMERLTTYWEARIPTISRRDVHRLSREEINEIASLLRPDFDLRPTLRTRLDHSYQDLIGLTREQYALLDALRDNPRTIVRGGAGTGKTLLALEETRRRGSTGESVLFCCYSRNLARRLSSALVDLPSVRSTNLHSLMWSLIEEAGLISKLPDVREEDLFTVEYPRLCLEAIVELDRIGIYQTLVMDESQDLLLPAYLEVVDALLDGGLADGNWMLYLDPYQDIFSGTHPAALDTLLATRPAQLRLNKNCRNTVPIHVTTRLLSSIEPGASSGVHGPEVETVWFTEQRDQYLQMVALVQRLVSEGLSPDDIVLLSPQKPDLESVRAAAKDTTQRFELLEESPNEARRGCVRLATVNGFKGLESKAVILLNIRDLESESSQKALYVACSRAVVYLAVFMREDLKSSFLKLASALGKALGSK